MKSRKEKRQYFGSIRIKNIYDGSIKGIRNTKTIGQVITRQNALDNIKILADFIASGKRELIITTHKFKSNEDGYPVSFLSSLR